MDKQQAQSHWQELLTKPPVILKKPRTLASLPALTQAEWDAFNGKARWDSIVALRGPDLIGSETLKWFSTAVIRWRLSGVMRVGGLVNNRLPFVVVPGHSLGRKPFDLSHWSDHVITAASWLSIPSYYADEATSKALFERDQAAAFKGLLDSKVIVGDHVKVVRALLRLPEEETESCPE
jgi:hypothetical protein